MSNSNENFLNQEQEDNIDQFVEQEYADENQSSDGQNPQTRTVLTEAIKRIEQAKLYETLLNHQLFTPGSARQEIIDTVQAEMQTFILERLEILLGMRAEKSVAVANTSPFDEGEINALKQLAGRLQARETLVSANPTLVPASAPQTSAVSFQQPVAVQPGIRPAGSPMAQPQQRPVQRQNGQAPTRKAAPRKKTHNVSALTGQDYSQARPSMEEAPNIPRPAPMPAQAMIDQMNATQVSRRQRDMGASPGVSKLLEAAISLAQKQNANVQE